MELVKFTTRDDVRHMVKSMSDARFYDVSTNAPLARDLEGVTSLCSFSPFIAYGKIPIPKFNGISDSVEGVWQGLKVINGRIDMSYFNGKGRKRFGVPKGHLYGDRVIASKEARQKIFIPSYAFMLRHCVPRDQLDEIYSLAREDVPQYFFDVDDNNDVGNLKSALAHSSVLVDIINKELQSANERFDIYPSLFLSSRR